MNFLKLKLNLLVLLFLLSVLPMSHAVLSVQTPKANKAEITKATFEKHLGRKLTFSEKIAFKIFNRKIKKAARPKKKQDKINAVDCGKIVLKTGEVLEVDLIQISPTEVKYKRCNKPEDPEFIVAKKDVFSIQNAAGEILYTNNIPAEKMAADAQETHRAAIASLTLGILGLAIFFIPFVGMVCGVLAFIFGATAKKNIREKPDTFKGRKMASFGLALGFIAFTFSLSVFLYIFTFI